MSMCTHNQRSNAPVESGEGEDKEVMAIGSIIASEAIHRRDHCCMGVSVMWLMLWHIQSHLRFTLAARPSNLPMTWHITSLLWDMLIALWRCLKTTQCLPRRCLVSTRLFLIFLLLPILSILSLNVLPLLTMFRWCDLKLLRECSRFRSCHSYRFSCSQLTT